MSYDLVKDSSYIALLHQGLINGRMVKKISAAVVVTPHPKQAAIMFPHVDGETDIRTMFYNGNISSDGGRFHEWCLDFFRYNWGGSIITKVN